MLTVRRFCTLAATFFIAAVGILMFSTQPVSAALTGCTFGSDLSRNLVSATCSETTTTNWFLQVACERPNNTIVTVNGTLRFGPGVATSIAICPNGTQIGAETLVEL